MKTKTMRRVLLESPYKGKDWSETAENLRYARACMHDSLTRGEAPFASHLLYTQEGILDDKVPGEREQGINAGLLWGECAEATVVYLDRGVSDGMKKGIMKAKECGRSVECRSLKGEVAKIESIVTDQGNGGSYCSACNHSLDLSEITSLGLCPHCGRPLVWGEPYINRGGSDF